MKLQSPQISYFGNQIVGSTQNLRFCWNLNPLLKINPAFKSGSKIQNFKWKFFPIKMFMKNKFLKKKVGQLQNFRNFMLGLQNLHVSKTSDIVGIWMRGIFSSKNLKFCSWATSFLKNDNQWLLMILKIAKVNLMKLFSNFVLQC